MPRAARSPASTLGAALCAALCAAGTLAAAATPACGTKTTPDEKPMSPSNLETIARIPWGEESDELPLSVVDFPQHSERSPDAVKSAEVPLFRVSGDGGVAALNYYGDRYLPAGKLKWFHRRADAAAVTARHSAHPFPDANDLLAVDFHVTDDGALILLETVADDGGRSSRIAVIAAGGAVTMKQDLGDARYDRIVPADDGRVFLLDRGHGNALGELDVATGAVKARFAAQPGTRLALAANQGSAVTAALLDNPPGGTIEAPSALPDALIYLFGVDGEGNYYVFMEPDIRVVSFAGELVRTISLADTLARMREDKAAIAPRLSPLVTWQVDQAGRIFVASVDAEGFSVSRVTGR